MSQALYRKWRPRRWEDVVGQEHVIQTLRNAVTTGRIAHAYLFAGPRGTGKTSVARLLAKAVNCLAEDLAERPCDRCDYCQAVQQGRFLDLIEIDAASNTSVDDVRDLRDKINFSPNLGRYKVYLVDEVHMLSTAAFNALLKTLEEPPAHAIFVLVTTEVHKIPATVLSRCQRHEFRRLPVAEIVTRLREMAAVEGLQVTPEALALIARQSTGSLRDAQSLLDQLASTGGEVTLGLAQSVLGTATSQAVLDIVEALLAADPAAGIDHIHRSLDAGSDPRQFARQVVDYFRNLLLIRFDNVGLVDATPELRAQMARHAQVFSTPQLLNILQIFNHATSDARGAWQPSLPLEIAFMESLTQSPAQAAEESPPEAPLVQAGVAPPAKIKSSPNRVAAPEEASPPAAPPAEGEAEDLQSTRTLNQNWRQVLSLVRSQNPNTYGLLNSCKARYLRGNVLTIGFASDVLKNQMAKKENLEIVQRALAQALGRDIAVRCVITTAKKNAVPSDVDNDGMVAAALRDLGGEIVDIQ